MAQDRYFDLETPHEILRVKPGGLYVVRVPGDEAGATLTVLHNIQKHACSGWDAPPTFIVLPDAVRFDKLERAHIEHLARAAGLLPPTEP